MKSIYPIDSLCWFFLPFGSFEASQRAVTALICRGQKVAKIDIFLLLFLPEIVFGRLRNHHWLRGIQYLSVKTLCSKDIEYSVLRMRTIEIVTH